MRENKFKKWLLFGIVTFVIILIIELGVIRIIDRKQEEQSLVLNVAQRIVDDLDQKNEVADEYGYSELFGRELTEKEQQEQRRLSVQQGMLIYNNTGMVFDFMLPDGNWFLEEDMVCVCLRLKTEDEAYRNYFQVENEEILNMYRTCSKDSFYSYDKSTKEMVERYRYYQLVFESFYLDDNQLLPEKVSLYKVESMLPENSTDSIIEVTDFDLVETMEFEVPNAEKLKRYEIAEKLDQYSITEVSYPYTHDGSGDCSVMSDCTLNGKGLSLKERQKLLEEGLNGTHDSRKRDLVGMSNYYYRTVTKNSQLLGGDVTAVVCEQNILYRAYLYAWKVVLAIIVADVITATFIAVIVSQIQKYRKNKTK